MRMEIIQEASDTMLNEIPAWPKKESIKELSGAGFKKLICMLQADAVKTGAVMKARIGDGHTVMIIYGKQKPNNTEDLKKMASEFSRGIRGSMSKMTWAYKELYGAALNDFDRNGLIM